MVDEGLPCDIFLFMYHVFSSTDLAKSSERRPRPLLTLVLALRQEKKRKENEIRTGEKTIHHGISQL